LVQTLKAEKTAGQRLLEPIPPDNPDYGFSSDSNTLKNQRQWHGPCRGSRDHFSELGAEEQTMDNVLLIGLSQQTAMMRNMDIIANNIANMNTTGFKSESVLFEEYLVDLAQEGEPPLEMAFVQDTSVIRNLEEGRFQNTGGTLDFAIAGEGFFVAAAAEGERYTRNGHFRVDTEGQLVTSDGIPILDVDGNTIVFSAQEKDFSVARDGSITTSAGFKGKLGIVNFEAPEALNKVGAGLYETEETPFPAEHADIIHGTIEQSNVKPIVEMTKMIEVMRSYQSVSQLLKTAEELQKRAIQVLGETS
jgi:flagellar basal-body rod protein FlgF